MSVGVLKLPEPKPSSAHALRNLEEKTQQLLASQVLLRKNEEATSPYTIAFDNLMFWVNPGVFSPAIFPDTYFFARNINIRSGEHFLEIGCGTGMIAALAAIRGASLVVATDINPLAVQNTLDNLKAHNLLGVAQVRQGDVYGPIEDHERFDTIWWNAPFMHRDTPNSTALEMALYDPNYAGLERFFADAQKHLCEGGHVLVGFSTTHGHFEVLDGVATRFGFALQVLAENVTPIPPSEGVPAGTFGIQLYEATPLKGGATQQSRTSSVKLCRS